jgi:apolipoprotein N-acyltransferase
VRLGAADDGPRLPVSLIVTDQFPAEPTDWSRVWRAYGPAVEAAARPGAVVLLPEKIVLLSKAQAQEAARQVAAVARDRSATLVVGMEVHENGRFFNRALVTGPDGGRSWYDKRRPVPGLESRITAGERSLVVRANGARVGVAICKDMHFAALGREYAQAGAAMVVVLAWDFDRDGWIADRMTALRGVESGYAVARATRNGVSSVRDRFGRIIVEAPSSGAARTSTGVVALAARPEPTLYARVGNLFGWSALLAAMGLAVLVRRRARA